MEGMATSNNFNWIFNFHELLGIHESANHRRRMEREAKAQVVVSIWGT